MGNLSQVLIGQRNCGGEWKWIIIMKRITADEGTDANRSLKWTSSLNARRKISISFLLQQSLKRFFNWYSEIKVYIKSSIYAFFAQKTNNSCDSSEQMAKIFLKTWRSLSPFPSRPPTFLWKLLSCRSFPPVRRLPLYSGGDHWTPWGSLQCYANQQSLRPVREPAGLIPHSCWLQKGVYDNRKPYVMSQRALTILSNGKFFFKKRNALRLYLPPWTQTLELNGMRHNIEAFLAGGCKQWAIYVSSHKFFFSSYDAAVCNTELLSN